MNLPESYKVTPANGPRPFGRQDRCSYCHQLLGEDHKKNCVMRERTIVTTYTITVVEKVPEKYTKEDFEFNRNEGTRCADNNMETFLAAKQHAGCLCGCTKAAYIREATQEDHERYGVANDD